MYINRSYNQIQVSAAEHVRTHDVLYSIILSGLIDYKVTLMAWHRSHQTCDLLCLPWLTPES